RCDDDVGATGGGDGRRSRSAQGAELVTNRTETAVPPEVTRGIETSAARRRVVIERLQPEIDGGRFPIKRTSGEWVTVTVDAFADGHDQLAGVLKYRKGGRGHWTGVPLQPLAN